MALRKLWGNGAQRKKDEIKKKNGSEKVDVMDQHTYTRCSWGENQYTGRKQCLQYNPQDNFPKIKEDLNKYTERTHQVPWKSDSKQ